MQTGPYIIDRWMVGMIRDICHEYGIIFRSFSDDWVLELEKNGYVHRVIGYQFDFNNAASAHIALDKVAAYQILASQNVSAVPHFLLRTKAGDAQWRTVSWEDGVVVKPLMGAGGHGVTLYFNEADARQAVQKAGIEAWAASPHRNAKREVRVILLGDERLFSYEKQPVFHDDGLKVFNLSQGAVPLPYEPSGEVEQLARRAKDAIGLKLCAVDIFELETGEWTVLEVNSGFMMENYARTSEDNKQQTIELYRTVVGRLFKE
ncbi:MAG TPA: ATP-grasp domain-containing protein [Candidatus Saccharimonadales bacterium]|nr:ATP-grasp domain-containing protein [Candidatus Saccharimonadales bacterium]